MSNLETLRIIGGIDNGTPFDAADLSLALVTLPMLSTRSNAARDRELPPDFPTISKIEQQWSALLDPARFQVLFEEATERPFSSQLDNEKHAGTFVCAACFLPLFDSGHKFDSGTGWPSFTQPIRGPHRQEEATSNWCCRGPSITARVATGIRDTSSTTVPRRAANDGATTGWR